MTTARFPGGSKLTSRLPTANFRCPLVRGVPNIVVTPAARKRVVVFKAAEDRSDKSAIQDAANGSAGNGDVQAKKSDAYSETMNRRMGTSLHYRHELGIDYNRILPDLIVGSCLQAAEDVDRLADEEGVTTIFCLQEDSDMAYFNLDIKPIQKRCRERGDIKHVRFPIHDFDPYDLRRKLPQAVSRLARSHDPSCGGTVYIHCTAGMGRAPATALAYMAWLRGWQLDEGMAHIKGLRQCGPKIEAIRSATSDLLLGTQPVEATIALYRWGDCTSIQIAGLDVGWNQPLDMVKDPVTQRYVLHRQLFPGKYQYKFIFDGSWTYSADHPTVQDGNNTNNLLEVIPATMDEEKMRKQVRLLSSGSVLTEDEQEELKALLNPWRNMAMGPGDCGAPAWAAEDNELESLDDAALVDV